MTEVIPGIDIVMFNKFKQFYEQFQGTDENKESESEKSITPERFETPDRTGDPFESPIVRYVRKVEVVKTRHEPEVQEQLATFMSDFQEKWEVRENNLTDNLIQKQRELAELVVDMVEDRLDRAKPEVGEGDPFEEFPPLAEVTDPIQVEMDMTIEIDSDIEIKEEPKTPPRKKRDHEGSGDESESDSKKRYKESLDKIFSYCPQAKGADYDDPSDQDAYNAMRMISSKPKEQLPRIKPAPCLEAQFHNCHKKLMGTTDKVINPLDTELGTKALVKDQFLFPRNDKHMNLLDECPLLLKLDEIPSRPIAKTEYKLFTSKLRKAQASWTDKLVVEVNMCEWAQLASVQALKDMAKKYAKNPEVAKDFSDISKITDLMGNNLARVEYTTASLKSNVVLNERDGFLATVFKEVPETLIKRARVTKVFKESNLIGNTLMGAMTNSIKTSQKKLTFTALSKLAGAQSHVSRSSGSSRNARSEVDRYQAPKSRGTHTSRGGDRSRSETHQQSKSRSSSFTTATPALPRGGGSGRGGSRGFTRARARGGRGNNSYKH